MADIVESMIVYVLGMVVAVTGVDTADFLITQPEINYVCNTQTGVTTSIMGYFALLGLGLSLVYFLIEINQKIAFERNDFTIKSFSVPFLKLMASYAILCNIDVIVSSLASIGNAFISWAGNFDIAFSPDDLNLPLDGMGFFMAIVMLIPMLIMMLVTIVCSLVWKYKAISFKLELLFRIGYSPIAYADVYSGQNSQALKWSKAFLGTLLYGASMLLIVKLGGAIATTQLAASLLALQDDGFENTWLFIKNLAAMIVYPIAELGAIGAVRQVIREALA